VLFYIPIELAIGLTPGLANAIVDDTTLVGSGAMRSITVVRGRGLRTDELAYRENGLGRGAW
jgi:hypothetical protein